MGNVGAERTQAERAIMGLGEDNQLQDYVDIGAIAAADVTADSTTLVGTGVTVQAVFEELDDAIATNTTAVAARTHSTGGGVEVLKAIGNSGANKTLALVDGTDGNVQTVGNSASCTYTMPSGLTASVGISFVLIVTNAGAFTATFTGVKWAGGSAPTLTSGAGKVDIFTFITTDGGTTWFGTVVQDVR